MFDSKRHILLFAFAFVLLVTMMILPEVIEGDPRAISPSGPLQPPGPAHPLGTDTLGRDVLTRVIYGGQQTLSIAIFATLFSSVLGFLIGTFAGTAGEFVDGFVVVLLNSLLALPGLIIALVILTIIERTSISLAIASGFAQIAPYAYVTRTLVHRMKTRGYIEAATALGSRSFGIVWRHLFPNSVPILLSYTAVTFSYNMLTSTSLSFLGLGGDPSQPEWGAILAEGRTVMQEVPTLSLIPALLMTATVLTINAVAARLVDVKIR